jgi:MYXO-CTERM domain-containing protein
VPRLEIEWTAVPAPGAAVTMLVGLTARRRRRA